MHFGLLSIFPFVSFISRPPARAWREERERVVPAEVLMRRRTAWHFETPVGTFQIARRRDLVIWALGAGGRRAVRRGSARRSAADDPSKTRELEFKVAPEAREPTSTPPMPRAPYSSGRTPCRNIRTLHRRSSNRPSEALIQLVDVSDSILVLRESRLDGPFFLRVHRRLPALRLLPLVGSGGDGRRLSGVDDVAHSGFEAPERPVA